MFKILICLADIGANDYYYPVSPIGIIKMFAIFC